MVEETNLPVENSDTASETQENTVNNTTPVVDTQPEPKERMYSKEEVQELMRKRIERSHRNVWNRYGVNSWEELDARHKSIDDYKTQLSDLEVKNAGLVKTNAYLTHNINPDRYGDIEAYFKGKDLKIDTDTLAKEIITHPEWIKQVVAPTPTTTIETLSPVDRGHTIAESEDEKMNRIYGI